MGSETLSFKPTPEQREQINQLAGEPEVNRSEVLRQVVQHGLAEMGDSGSVAARARTAVETGTLVMLGLSIAALIASAIGYLSGVMGAAILTGSMLQALLLTAIVLFIVAMLGTVALAVDLPSRLPQRTPVRADGGGE